jgi:hypothetical protein
VAVISAPNDKKKMNELAYISIAVPHDLDDAALLRILDGARDRNRSFRVTGLLLYQRGELVQLLEGERDAARSVYHHFILRDPQHTSVNLCWDFDIERRSFPDWSMGFYRPDSKMYEKNASLDGYLEGGVAALDLSGPPSTGRQLLFEIYAQIDPAQSAPGGAFHTSLDENGVGGEHDSTSTRKP